MLAGMTASVSIVIEGVQTTLCFSQDDAVRKTSSSAFVYTLHDGTGELGEWWR